MKLTRIHEYVWTDDYSFQRELTCKNHLDARYLTKNPWHRSIHLVKIPEGDMERSETGECLCPFDDLMVIEEEKIGQPYGPDMHDINFWQKCVNGGMAAEFSPEQIAALGLTDTTEQRWYAQDRLTDARVAYMRKHPPTPMPYLRPNEELVGITVYFDDHERHCSWGKHSLGGEICRKPVMEVSWRWDEETAKRNSSHGLRSNWRHIDGTPLHRTNDPRPEFQFEQYESCTPLGICGECGKEWVKDHCSDCHNNDVLKLQQVAYQDIITCTTPGCPHETRISIGD